jgi:hypothetical protein
MLFIQMYVRKLAFILYRCTQIFLLANIEIVASTNSG